MRWSIYLLVPKAYGDFYKGDLSDMFHKLMNGYDPQGYNFVSTGYGEREEYDEKIALEYIEGTEKNFNDWLKELDQTTDFYKRVKIISNMDLEKFDNNWLIGFKMGNIAQESEFVPIWSKKLLDDYIKEIKDVYMVSISIHL